MALKLAKRRFVAAVETTEDKKPRRLRLKVVKGFRKREIAKLAKADIATGTKVESDGLSCWSALTEAGCEHSSIKTGSGQKGRKPGALQMGQHHARNSTP